jgi:hypothetical protein
MPAVLAILLALSGANSYNPYTSSYLTADCLVLPIDQQSACVQAIRTGGNVEIPGLDSVRDYRKSLYKRWEHEQDAQTGKILLGILAFGVVAVIVMAFTIHPYYN